MTDGLLAESRRLLDPIDRISEGRFALIMGATIIGPMSMAGAGHQEVRTVPVAALGYNLALGPGLAMLFAAGYALGRYAVHTRPLLIGSAMQLFGAVLIGVVMALGGCLAWAGLSEPHDA